MFRTLLLSTVLIASAADGVDVVTQRGDNQRTAVNAKETQLNHQSVKTNFGKLWTLFADSKVMAQPLYVSNLVVPVANAFSPAAKAKCPAGCNAVLFGTMKGTLYVYLADDKATTNNDTLIWSRYLGDPRIGGRDIDMWATDDPVWGILGTPAIDIPNKLVYVVVWNKDNNYRLYALDLQSGNPKKGPVVIQGSVNGTQFFTGGTQVRKQRAGLLLDHGSLYIAFGGDESGMAGWLFVYDAASLALKTLWSPVPGGPNGGIWMSGQGLIADKDGFLYLQTANGAFDNNAKKWGNSLLKIKLAGTEIQVADFFAPCNTEFMNNNDLDLGSAGPLLLPENLIVGGGKFGALYLMSRKQLGHFQPGAPVKPPVQPGCKETNLVLQEVQATHGHIHGSPVFWQGPGNNDWIYVMGEGDNLKAFPFQKGRMKTGDQDIRVSGFRPPAPTVRNCHGDLPDNWMPGGALTVSSNGRDAGTGIVWAIGPANGDANSFRGVKGMLMAFNAEDVRQELWRSQGTDPNTDTNDSSGLLARFAPVTVANGKVFVGNAGDQEPLAGYCEDKRPTTFPNNFAVVVYGLKNK